MKEEPLMIVESELTASGFSSRLAELRWTLYRLAKEYCVVVGNEKSPASRYHSTLGKVLASPDNSSLGTIKKVVQALDGEIIIRWREVPEDRKGELLTPKSTEDRLDELENLLLKLLDKIGDFEQPENK